ncbi:MAG: hypothetical protein K2X48_08025 [Chitinophagaceae bacterium]|nr:hypothetical protein [Chitinophagaceae bacterium]
MSNFYIQDGFQFFRKTSKVSDILGDRLVIENDKLSKTVDYINRNSIKTITVNPIVSTVDDLSFLEQIPCVEGLYLLQDNLDITAINNLGDLRVLHLNKLDSSIDFTNLKKLEVLGCTFNKELKNIEHCKLLFWLWLDNFKLHDLTCLSGLTSLKYLNLYKTSIMNLNGIALLENLNNLTIDGASKLVSLEGLGYSNQSLYSLDISNAKHLISYDQISKLKCIKKVHLYKTGVCENFDFLNNLESLTEFVHGGKYIKKVNVEL